MRRWRVRRLTVMARENIVNSREAWFLLGIVLAIGLVIATFNTIANPIDEPTQQCLTEHGQVVTDPATGVHRCVNHDDASQDTEWRD